MMNWKQRGSWGNGLKSAKGLTPPPVDSTEETTPAALLPEGTSSRPSLSPTESLNASPSPAAQRDFSSPSSGTSTTQRWNLANLPKTEPQTDLPAPPQNSVLEAFKKNIHQRLIAEIDFTQSGQGSGEAHDEKIKQRVRDALQTLIEEEAKHVTDSATALGSLEQLTETILNEVVGLGPLEALLKDDSITEIMVNGPQCVFIERSGRLIESNITFKDDSQLLQVIDRIVSAVGRRVDETQPLCDARLKDGSRFNCVIPPLALDGALVTIRKFSKRKMMVEDLVRIGSLTPEAAKLLQAFVEGHLNIVISGGTGSGKTTLLNVLSSFIPEGDRIVTIEDTAELQLQQSHVARMETRPANIEGKGEITMRDLVKNSLRMRPERIVVGECRGGEALDMLQAMNTGHDGSMTTLHANNPRDAIRRMETMVMMAGYDLPQKAIREQVASAVNVIIQASRLSCGSRRVMNITEIVGMEGDQILLQDIFAYQQRGIDEEGKAIGKLEFQGVRPKFLDTLVSRGIDVEMSMFDTRNRG
jgi:pilus assembly protein CpaF